jgi:hypothetical protein
MARLDLKLNEAERIQDRAEPGTVRLVLRYDRLDEKGRWYPCWAVFFTGDPLEEETALRKDPRTRRHEEVL